MQQQQCGFSQSSRNAVQAIPKHAIIIFQICSIREIIKLCKYVAWSIFNVAYGSLFVQANKWIDSHGCFIVFVPEELWWKS